MSNELKINSHIVKITNPDKILFPKDKITKLDLINYYKKIGDIMLEYTKDHPLTMHRYPNGINEEGFFHKDAPDFFPKWIETVAVKKKEEGQVKYVVANNVATLVYLANYGCLTPHLWLSKTDKLEYPDRMIFDLDPANEDQFDILKEKALIMKKLLEEIGLTAFVNSTGSRGLHIYVPLKRNNKFDVVKDFAQDIAKFLINLDSKRLTMEIRKAKRGKKIFIDTLRNGFGATAVAPYSVRAKNGAPVAFPLYWEELKNPKLGPQDYNIFNIFERLKKKGDPYKNMNKYAGFLSKAKKEFRKIK